MHITVLIYQDETVICSIIVAKADDTFYHMIYLRKPNIVTPFTKYCRHGIPVTSFINKYIEGTTMNWVQVQGQCNHNL